VPSRGALSNAEAPSLKVTTPVRMPLPGWAATNVAVKVTGEPASDGFCEEKSNAANASLLTVSASAGPTGVAARIKVALASL
jgi:hypothetical protein